MNYFKFLVRCIGWGCAISAVLSTFIYFGAPFFALITLALIFVVLGAER
jgi:hypothetical protein